MGTKQQSAAKPTEKQPKADASSDESAAVVVASQEQAPLFKKLPGVRKLPPHLRLPVVVAVVVLIVAVGWLAWDLTRTNTSSYKTPLAGDIDTDYASTNPNNFPVLLKHDYDLTLNDIEKGNLKNRLKTFDEAHDVGIVLYRLHKLDRTLDAYAIAEDKLPADMRLTFYKEYCGFAYEAKNVKLGDATCDKAIKTVEDSHMADIDKKDAVSMLNYAKQTGREEAAK